MGKAEVDGVPDQEHSTRNMSRQRRWYLDFKSLNQLILKPICDLARRIKVPGLMFAKRSGSNKRSSSRSRSRTRKSNWDGIQ